MSNLFQLKLQHINSKDIVVDEEGQRYVYDKARERQFRYIIKHFDPYLVNPVKVGYIDKKYYCFDGQMTLRVLKEMNGGKDLAVPCLVYDIDLNECANLFLKQNGKVVNISAFDKFRVQENKGAGVDGGADAQEIRHVAQKYGFVISGSPAKNTIAAIKALTSAYDTLGYEGFDQLIRILRYSWDGEADSISGLMVGGLAMFIEKYDENFDEQKLITRLHKVAPAKVLRDAYVLKPGKKGVARKILEIYNTKNGARLPDEL